MKNYPNSLPPSPPPHFWAIIPAAGSGERLGGETPKQYRLLQGKPLIAHSIACLLAHLNIQTLVVSIAANDPHWPAIQTAFPAKKIITVEGGATRQESVYQGLLALQNKAKSEDWVLVHDAVRPCLQQADIQRLMTALQGHPVGGLFGVRVRDTLKYTDQTDHILKTLDRQNMWQAHTPQMFRYGLLRDAIRQALEKNEPLTDEASAIEKMGAQPLMIEGPLHNIKITYAEDLGYAEKLLNKETT
jgi:2-C-methyl-D-erythritol 4-phosphate cytidylyltransferase